MLKQEEKPTMYRMSLSRWTSLAVMLSCRSVSLASSAYLDQTVSSASLRQELENDEELVDEDLLFGNDDDEDDDMSSLQPYDSTDMMNDEDASYRSKDEWWKDPLALFEDEEDTYKMPDAAPNNDALDDEQKEAADQTEMEPQSTAALTSDMEGSETDTKENEVDNENSEEDKDEGTTEEEFETETRQEDGVKVEAMNKVNIESDTSDGSAERETEETATTSKAQSSIALPRPRSGSFSAPATFLVPSILPKLKSAISLYSPFRILGAAALARVVYQSVSSRQGPQQNQPQESQPTSQDYDETDSLYDDRDYDQDVVDEIQEEEQVKKVASNPLKMTRIIPTGGFLAQVVNSVAHGRRQRVPSAKKLMEERDALLERVQLVQTERDNMEREYERTSWQLQEVQSDLQNQASTTKYLKAQLRDNEQMMERAVRAERARAKEELKRMKEAMLRVLERERQAMREEVKRQSAELQKLLEEANGVDAVVAYDR